LLIERVQRDIPASEDAVSTMTAELMRSAKTTAGSLSDMNVTEPGAVGHIPVLEFQEKRDFGEYQE